MGPTLWEPTLGVSSDACRQGIYIRAFDGLIDRPIAPYLFIFHRVLAPGTISSFSFHCVRTRGGKNMKSPRPPFPRAWHSINFFFVAPPKSLPKPIDCHIPARRKNEAADVPGLLTPAPRFGKLSSRKNKYYCDRIDLTLCDS